MATDDVPSTKWALGNDGRRGNIKVSSECDSNSVTATDIGMA